MEITKGSDMSKVQIEKTAKKFKLMLVLCRLAYLVAVIWGMCAVAGANVNGGEPSFAGPVALFAVALVVALVTKFLIWWNHG